MKPTTPPWTWDIFCHVIDNWGDLGVCWRLGADLASRGQRVRLWTDDPAPLQWMAPGALEGHWPGLTVYRWDRAPGAPVPTTEAAGDVLVEAFGCQVQDAWVDHLLPLRGDRNPVWINLEYLSAESYVERCHRLLSPVMSGPLKGRQKWFFYPGFTPSTGGLLRETDLMPRREAFARATPRTGIAQPPPRDCAPTVTLFCYEPRALPALLQHPDLTRAHWHVAPGRARAAFETCQAALPSTACWTALPFTSQRGFDQTLWASDLNLVRGEDSLVRALWAGQAFVWQIYPQDDDAHHAKLQAFLDWLQAPADLREMHACWNGLSAAPLPALDGATLGRWREVVLLARQRLLDQPDLTTQLLGFVTEKR